MSCDRLIKLISEFMITQCLIEEHLKQLASSALREVERIKFKGYQPMISIRKSNKSKKIANIKK